MKPVEHSKHQPDEPLTGGRDAVATTAFVRESVYATFTGLALVTVLLFDSSHVEVGEAIATVGLGIVGIALAGLVAWIVGFMLSHRDFPPGAALRAEAKTAAGALATAFVPLLSLFLVVLGWISIELALQLSVGIYFANVCALLLLAARRTGLPRRQQLVALAMLFGLAIVVVVTLAVAHAL